MLGPELDERGWSGLGWGHWYTLLDIESSVWGSDGPRWYTSNYMCAIIYLSLACWRSISVPCSQGGGGISSYLPREHLYEEEELPANAMVSIFVL